MQSFSVCFGNWWTIAAVERGRRREEEKINFPPHKISEIRLFGVGKNIERKNTQR